jgi:effector-binding domain-containing protein
VDYELKDLEERSYIGIRQMIPPAKMAEMMGPLYMRLYGYVGQKGLQPVGGALAIYYSEPTPDFDVECAVTVNGDVEGEGDIKPGTIPAGKYLMTRYVGPYEGLRDAWGAFMVEANSRGLELRWPGWEEYIVDPQQEPDPAKYETMLVSGVE